MLFVIFNDTAGFVKKNALNNQTNFCINLVSNSLKKKKMRSQCLHLHLTVYSLCFTLVRHDMSLQPTHW